MSTFIIKADYAGHIRNNRLDGIVDFDDSLLDKAELRAIKVMQSHLNARYNVEEIFNKVEPNRDQAILGFCIDLTLYYLYRMANPRKVPSYRKEAYIDAMDWLDGVKDGSIVPKGLPLSLDEDGNNIKAEYRYGSLSKRTNHIS